MMHAPLLEHVLDRLASERLLHDEQQVHRDRSTSHSSRVFGPANRIQQGVGSDDDVGSALGR